MKWIILLVVGILGSCCQATKKIGFDYYKMDDFCRSALNDLEKKVYKIDNDFYELRFNSQSKKERIDEFLKLSDTINRELNSNHKDCLKLLTSADIIGHFGTPTKVSKRVEDGSVYSVAYRLNFGGKCPCEHCAESERYDECNVLDFNFDSNNRLININLTDLYHGLK